VASVAAGWLLAPVERLRRRLALIEVAEGEAPLELETTADADRIADFFSSISRSVAERDTEGDGDDWVGALLSGLDDGVIVIDGHGRIVSISRSAERLVSGDPDDEVRGRLLHDVLAKDHPLRELVATALLEGASGPQSVSFGYDGTTVECVVTAQTMHRSAGAPGVLVRARDALQMSRLISQLSYSQKLTSLGRLTAGVAHEIKNPLNAIAMQVELAKRRGERGGDGAGELVAPLEAIDTEVRRLDRVVQAFLQFTRPEEVRFEPVDLDALADPPFGQVLESRRSIRVHDDARPLTAAQLGEFLYRSARVKETFADEREELKDRLAELREEIEAIERRLDEVGT